MDCFGSPESSDEGCQSQTLFSKRARRDRSLFQLTTRFIGALRDSQEGILDLNRVGDTSAWYRGPKEREKTCRSTDDAPWQFGQGVIPLTKWLEGMPCNPRVWGSNPPGPSATCHSRMASSCAKGVWVCVVALFFSLTDSKSAKFKTWCLSVSWDLARAKKTVLWHHQCAGGHRRHFQTFPVCYKVEVSKQSCIVRENIY